MDELLHEKVAAERTLTIETLLKRHKDGEFELEELLLRVYLAGYRHSLRVLEGFTKQ